MKINNVGATGSMGKHLKFLIWKPFIKKFFANFRGISSCYHINVPRPRVPSWGGKIRLFNNRTSCRWQERGNLPAFLVSSEAFVVFPAACQDYLSSPNSFIFHPFIESVNFVNQIMARFEHYKNIIPEGKSHPF
jgi:hypothetical protein